MRHRVKTNNLNRTTEHRKALYRNLAINLFTWSPDEIERAARRGLKERRQAYRHYNKPFQIRTTLNKAKASQSFIERLITLAKKGTLHHRRRIIALLGGTLTAKQIAKKLISEIAPKFANRNGGYTRIIKLPTQVRMSRLENHMVEGKKRSRYLGSRLGDNSTLCLFELVEFDGEDRSASMTTLLPDSVAEKEREIAESVANKSSGQSLPGAVG